ncbi:MAG: prephenate dehydrogenase [Gemmatimonadota bacterium]|nr:prephenate dehydrogenase [Gemmatimonadota bacterium]
MSREFAFERVGIVGLGLMGGSLARALRVLANPPRIVAFNRHRDGAERALAAGEIDAVADSAEEAAGGKDLVIYATPLDVALEMMRDHAAGWGDATVTDVAGLKEPLARVAGELGFAEQFVGSHPMAGGTATGYEASSADLFAGETVFVCGGAAESERIEAVESMWQAMGARVRPIEADAHDRLMVWASHLPQLVSNVLSRAMAEAGLRVEDLGPGGRDLTRLAGSSPEMWTSLLDEASEENLRAIESMQDGLDFLRTALSERSLDEVAQLMRATREWRRGQ